MANNKKTHTTRTVVWVSIFKVGDQVKVKVSATTYAIGQTIASFVKGSTYEVISNQWKSAFTL